MTETDESITDCGQMNLVGTTVLSYYFEMEGALFSQVKKEKGRGNRENRTSTRNIFKFKMTEEIKKYKSICHSHFEGRTD